VFSCIFILLNLCFHTSHKTARRDLRTADGSVIASAMRFANKNFTSLELQRLVRFANWQSD